MIASKSLVFVLSFFVKTVFLKEMKSMNVQDLIKLAEDISQARPNDVLQTDVTLYLFTRNTSNLQLNTDNIVDNTKPTKFLIHGWLEEHKNSWYARITQEYLQKGDFNIIQVDWNRVARSSYVSSAQNTRLVGEELGRKILQQDLKPDKIHLIGHSLGAHVAAFAAEKIFSETGTKISRITGLDPAGPYFREHFISRKDRLNSDNAKIVDVIHTDGGFYGYEKPTGTLDIYVNGGTRIQPGCFKDLTFVPIGAFIEETFCSHAKSHEYFVEIINEKKFTCVKCESWEGILLNTCKDKETYSFGSEDVKEDMNGVCFVKTDPVTIPVLFDSLMGYFQ